MPGRPALLALLLALALLAAGCGGAEVAYQEVKLPPPTLTVPDEGDAPAADDDPDADETPTPTPTPADGTAGGTTGGTTPGTTGGTTGGATTPGTTGGTSTPAPQATQAPSQDTGGATADEGLDQFCADNPGACEGDGGTP